MLVELIKQGYGNDRKLNCAQKIIYASNEVYQLGLNEDALSLAGGFGGGMGIESTCGTLTAGVMVLGKLFPIKDDESKKQLYALSKEFISSYKEHMGAIDCTPLKQSYRKEEVGCQLVIEEAAILLEKIILRELNNKSTT